MCWGPDPGRFDREGAKRWRVALAWRRQDHQSTGNRNCASLATANTSRWIGPAADAIQTKYTRVRAVGNSSATGNSQRPVAVGDGLADNAESGVERGMSVNK